MARINLLTRHSGESYGAVLQTYATCRILQSLGHKVTIINLIEKKRIKRYFSISSIPAYPKYINFWKFKYKYYPHRTRVMTRIDSGKIPEADYTIVGSDQVWRSKVTKENKLAYFLDFAKNSKKLSLASSFGCYQWEEDEKYTEKVKECLLTFSAVSVRETSGVDICRDTFGIDATCIVDPTIAWGDYDALIDKHPKEQIACFILNINNPLFYKVADKLVDETRMKALVLDNYSGSKYKYLKYYEKSPVRWLNEMYNSKIVITDSFHGVAFSVLFKKQFFVVPGGEKAFARIDSLLKKVGMRDRVITSIDDLNNRVHDMLGPMDYQYAEEVLKGEREKYYDYVKANIK